MLFRSRINPALAMRLPDTRALSEKFVPQFYLYWVNNRIKNRLRLSRRGDRNNQLMALAGHLAIFAKRPYSAAGS